MADERFPSAVTLEGFSEEVLAWMAQGDALANARVEEEGFSEDGEAELSSGAGPKGRRLLELAREQIAKLATVATKLADAWRAEAPQRRRWIAAGSGAALMLVVGGIALRSSSPANARTAPIATLAAAESTPATTPAPTEAGVLPDATVRTVGPAGSHKASAKKAPKGKTTVASLQRHRGAAHSHRAAGPGKHR